MQLDLFKGATDAMAVSRRADNGAWQVSLGKHRHSDRNWSKADALRYEAQYLEQHVQAASPTLEIALDRWLADYLPHLKNQANYRSKAQHLRPYLKHATCDDAAEVARTLKRDWAHLKPATVNRRLAMLKRIVKLAYEEWEWCAQPQHRKIKLIPERNERHNYLLRSDVERLRMNCTNPEAGNLIVFAAFTGLRWSEMFRARAHDVRGNALWLDNRTKNGRPRAVPLHPRALHIALELPYRITPALLVKQWAQARRLSGLEHIHWHDLRHTCASWLVQAGVSLYVVKDILGHASIKTTERYAHLANHNLQEAIDRL